MGKSPRHHSRAGICKDLQYIEVFCGFTTFIIGLKGTSKNGIAFCEHCTIDLLRLGNKIAIQRGIGIFRGPLYTFYEPPWSTPVFTARGNKRIGWQPLSLHQKIMILDDQISSVGTANLDNRSFHLNFEITAMSIDARLQQHMSQVFLKDLEHSYLMCPERLSKWQKNFLFRLLVQIARLFAPLL